MTAVPSAFSPNKAFELQATGEHNGTWGVALNAVISLIDQLMGGSSTLATTTGAATISTGQLDTFLWRTSAALVGNVTYNIPAAVSGYFMFDNQSTGAFSITIASLTGGGRSLVCPQGAKTYFFCDGTNVDVVQTSSVIHCGTTAGSSTAYTANIPQYVSAYYTGLTLEVVFNATSGATPTINFTPPGGGALGAKNIYRAGQSTVVQLTTSEVSAQQTGILVYDAALNAAAGGFFLIGQTLTANRQVIAGTGLTGGGTLSAGDVTITLPNTGSAATTGDSTHVAQITTDAQGRITTATAVAINAISALGFTPANRAGDTLSGALNDTRVTVASGVTPAIFAANATYIDYTGTGSATGFDTIQAGVRRVLRCASTPTFASNSSILMPGSAAYIATAGDILEFTSEGGGVARLTGFMPAAAPLLGSIATSPPGAINLVITNNVAVPNTKVDYTADYVTMANAVGQTITFSNVSSTINTAGTGADGMDTGAQPASAWLYLWFISNGTLCKAYLSTSATAPSTANIAGYTFKWRAGSIYSNGSTQFTHTCQRNREVRYIVSGSAPTTALPQVISGASGNTGTPTWTATALTTLVPPTAAMYDCMLQIGSVGSSYGCMAAPNNSYGALNSLTNPPPLYITTNNSAQTDLTTNGRFNNEQSTIAAPLTVPTVYYASGGAQTALWITGWVER